MKLGNFPHKSIKKATSIIFVSLFAIFNLFSCNTFILPVSDLKVTIDDNGKYHNVLVPAGTTVQSILEQAGVKVNSLDRLEPPGYALIQSETTIKITRVRESYEVEEVVIPFVQQTVENETLPEGHKLLIQKGINGLQQITYRHIFENEIEVSRAVFKVDTIKESLPEITMVGIQNPFTPQPIPGKLAYITNGNSWLMEGTTGKRRPLVISGDLDGRVFSISNNGKWLLFTRNTSVEGNENTENLNSLWMINLTNENSKPIFLRENNIALFASWVPYSDLSIIFSTVEPRSTAPGWQANNDLQLRTYNETGGILKKDTFIDVNSGGIYGWWGTVFSFSPNGQKIAYSRPDSIGLVDLESGSFLPIVSNKPLQTNGDWAWVSPISWSENGDLIYIVTHKSNDSETSREATPDFDLATIISSSGEIINLITNVGMFATPVVSPEYEYYRSSVSYLQAINPEDSEKSRYRVNVCDLDGSNQRVLYPSEKINGILPQRVVWEPSISDTNSPRMALIDQGNIYLIDTSTRISTQITGDGAVTKLDWK